MRLFAPLSVLLALALPCVAQTESVLLASDDFPNRFFGSEVAIDGDVAIVAADGDDDVAMDSGAAYVYRRNALSWIETQKITAPDLVAFDRFGQRMAFSGDVAVFATPAQDHPVHGVDTGAVYVYRDVGGTFVFEAKLTASNIFPGQFFGTSVAVDGDTILVGAVTSSVTTNGFVHVFEFDGSSWNAGQILTGSDSDPSNLFGSQVAIDGNWLAVGDPRKFETFADAGAVYMFWHDGTAWSEVQKLVASDPGAGDFFGSVALDGNVVAVGAPFYEDGVANDTGALFVFRESGGVWSEEQKLITSNAQDLDRIGRSLDVANDTIVAGAQTDTTAINAGSFYVFEFDGSSWNETDEVAPSDFKFGDNFGGEVAFDGVNIIAGAESADNIFGMNSGKAYIYSWPGSANYPGTGDDLQLRSAVNGPLDGFDVKQVTPGDVVTLNLRSPGGTLDAAPFYLLAQPFVTATPPAPIFDFWFDLSVPITILFDSAISPFGSIALPPGGFGMTFAVPSTISGVSVMAQGLSLSALTGNGVYATSGAHELLMP